MKAMTSVVTFATSIDPDQPEHAHIVRLHTSLHIGDVLCKIVNFFPIFVITSSIYTLVFISFERYRAIIYSNEPQMTLSKLKCIIPLTWVFSLAVSIPTLIEYSVNTVNESFSGANGTEYRSTRSCDNESMPHYYAIINAIVVTVVSYLIPVILMMKNYFQVALFVWRQGRQISEHLESTIGGAVCSFRLFRQRVKLVKILVLIALLFAASWLPFFILMLYAKITHNDTSLDASGLMNLFMIFLATFSTVYNIVLYVVYHPSYRQAFKKALRCTKDSNLDSTLRDTIRDSAGNGYSPGDNHLGVSTIPRQDGHTHLSHITVS